MNIDLIREAHSRLSPYIAPTPVLNSPFLDAIAGRKVFIKAECLQKTGSFKYRGARNALMSLPADALKRGVIAFSSGNHAQGVALAAREMGSQAVIVMPADAPALKIANTRALGAEVVLYDRATQDRDAIGQALAHERNLTLVRPFDDPHVIAGQGTIGIEIAAHARDHGIAQADLLVPCGGGGLASGIALAVEAEAPGLRLHPVEPEGFDDVARSLRSGSIQSNAHATGSVCDSILTPAPGTITFPILQRLAHEGLTIRDEDAMQAMAHALQRLKIVAEPGGAAALAAALYRPDQIDGECVYVVVSGGNADPAMIRRALDRLDMEN